MMNVHVVAAKDYRDAMRSHMLLALSGLLVALIGIVYVGGWWVDPDAEPAFLAEVLALPLQVIVPLLALIAGYMSIVGERRSGSIKLLLGLPPTRSDVIVGKLIGRLAVVTTAIVVGGVVASGLSLVLFGTLALGDLGAVFAGTVLLGAAFVGIAVGVSAMAPSRGKAMAVVVGLYVLFVGFWNVLGGAVFRVVEGGFPPNPIIEDTTIPPWILLFDRLNPMDAYSGVVSWLFDGEIFPLTLQFPIGVPNLPEGQLPDAIGGSVPWYLSEWVALLILLAWLVVPVVIGFLAFRRADIG